MALPEDRARRLKGRLVGPRTAGIAACLFALLVASACANGEASAPQARASSQGSRGTLIARAEALELDTEVGPPPGDALEHHTAGFAKILCSAVFITGLDPDFAAENVGFFSSPYEQRKFVTERIVDRDSRSVHLTLGSGVTVTARHLGDQGCVALPKGEDSVYYTPVEVVSELPEPDSQPWPMGDVLPDEPLPSEIDAERVGAAVDAAFEPQEGMTAAFVVTYKGRLIGERYAEGIDKNTPLESWSMGKSLTATLLGLLIQQGVYDLWQPAPVPAWQGEAPGLAGDDPRPAGNNPRPAGNDPRPAGNHPRPAGNDPRAKIRIADILRMSSGLRFRAPQDPDFDRLLGYPDHLYVDTGAIDSFEWATERPLQWESNTVGRYRNSDPVTINYLIRLAVEGRGEDYHQFPQRALFDKLGMRDMVLETDPYGNFLLQGYELGSGRDWARLGNLYLQDGVWNDERLLPEGWVEFVRTVAPAWEADGRPIYGGFFWINGTGAYPIPRDAYYMSGAGNQKTFIIPSHNLVVVRLGHYRGSAPGNQGLTRALELLMEAVPASR